ncbi:MAG: lasso peptide biosynthesis B2 protein [Clostridiaceae bacterium]
MNEPVKVSWWKSLRDAPAKWRRRNRTERILLVEAFLLLGMARLGVMILPFRWLAKSLGHHMKQTDTQLPPADLPLAHMVGAAVRSAANYTPWKSVCLPQAVAAQWMLKRRNIPGTVYLGVMKDETKPEKLAAHAWLRCGHIILTGAKGHHQYTVVSTFS